MYFVQEIISKLTAKDDKYASAVAERIISESLDTDKWYECFDDFASLLNHPKSLVRNRVLYILAANAQWDDENRFDAILDDYLTHVTDEKPITARQCIKALAQVGKAKPQYIEKIMDYLHSADLSKYKDKIDEALKLLAEKDTALEINTSGLRQKLKATLPDEDIVRRFRQLGGKMVTIGSDAHYAEHLGSGIETGMEIAKRCGFDSVTLFQSRNPVEIPIE